MSSVLCARHFSRMTKASHILWIVNRLVICSWSSIHQETGVWACRDTYEPILISQNFNYKNEFFLHNLYLNFKDWLLCINPYILFIFVTQEFVYCWNGWITKVHPTLETNLISKVNFCSQIVKPKSALVVVDVQNDFISGKDCPDFNLQAHDCWLTTNDAVSWWKLFPHSSTF